MPARKKPVDIERKFVAGALAGTVFFLLAVLLRPVPYLSPVDDWINMSEQFVNQLPIYMMYIMPAMMIYFALSSMISDRLAHVLARKQTGQFEELYAFLLHLLFGLILLWNTFAAMVMFFVADRLLRKTGKNFTYKHALLSQLLPLSVWFIFMIAAFMMG